MKELTKGLITTPCKWIEWRRKESLAEKKDDWAGGVAR